jgi:hypothetical protein
MYIDAFTATQNNPANASNFYGYPHLGYPGSHYDITPFDALFTFDQNTEHRTGLAKHPTQDIGLPTEFPLEWKNFLLQETEGTVVYLQNKRIGFYSRPNYQYRVDYSPAYFLFIGENVTQKTDFLPVTFESNCEVEAMAGEAIIMKPGVHIKNGAQVHLFIGEMDCPKSGFAVVEGGDNTNTILAASGKNNKSKGHDLLIFPNPSNGGFTISCKTKIKSGILDMKIYNATGILCYEDQVTLGQAIRTNLPKGFYIVSLLINDEWETLKIVIEN